MMSIGLIYSNDEFIVCGLSLILVMRKKEEK